MKFFTIQLVFITLASLSAYGQITPNFELWNKHIQPVYYAIGTSKEEVSKKPMQEIRPGKFVAATRDTTQPTAIALAVGKKPEAGQRIDVSTMNRDKNLYLRVGLPSEKEKLKETIKTFLGRKSLEFEAYIFGPQTGPLLGFKGVTERGHPLKNNIGTDGISRSWAIYLPGAAH